MELLTMVHIAFNFADPLVQLRLSGLLACIAIIVCLSILELAPPRRWYGRVPVLAVMGILVAGVGYVLASLGA